MSSIYGVTETLTTYCANLEHNIANLKRENEVLNERIRKLEAENVKIKTEIDRICG